MSTIALPVINRFRMDLTPLAPMLLNHFSGSAWRGVLGHGLRRVSCVTRAKSCEDCLLQQQCVYTRVFETRMPEGGRCQARPHPFVLEPPEAGRRVVKSDECLTLGITLFGNAREALPYLIQALKESGRRGMGRDPVPFTLQTVEQEVRPGSGQWRQIFDGSVGALNLQAGQVVEAPAVPERARIELRTPLRMKQKGRLVGPREFEAAHFLRQLWRRTKDLSRFYGQVDAVCELKMPVIAAADANGSRPSLRWLDWTRYSSRQKSAMQMGGLVGGFTLDGAILEDWWPLLWYGQWSHLGKATSMGLGRYRIVEPQACRQGKAVG